MQRHWNEQELETYWSFSSDEFELISNGDDSSRLGVGAWADENSPNSSNVVILR